MQRYRPRIVVLYSQTEALPLQDRRSVPAWGPAHVTALTTLLQQTYERLTVNGAHIVVITPLLRPPPVEGCADTLARATCADTRLFNAGIVEFSNVLRSFARSHPLLTLIDVGALVCGPSGGCPYQRNGLVWRPDGVHFTMASGERVAARVSQIIRTLHLMQS